MLASLVALACFKCICSAPETPRSFETPREHLHGAPDLETIGLKSFGSLLFNLARNPALGFVSPSHSPLGALTKRDSIVHMKEPLLVEEGPVIQYLADRIQPIVGPSSAYGAIRKDMMKAFAAYSNDKTDMGAIDSAESLKCLMESCGEEFSDTEAEDMFATMLELPKAKPSQMSGTFVYEQWAKTVMDKARAKNQEEQSDLQRLAAVAAPAALLIGLVVLIPLFS